MKYLKIPIYIFLISINFYASAQTGNPFYGRILSLSQSDDRADKFRFDLNKHTNDIISANPALYELQNKNGAFLKTLQCDSINPLDKVNIGARYSDAKIKGDYLPDVGNAFTDMELLADAVKTTKKHGSVFGSTSFSKGIHKGYGWSALRHADLYRPYVVVDSVGGDFKYENYFISGGYSFNLGRGYYGAGGSFRGEIASKETDPRSANNTIWLNLDFAAAYKLSASTWLALRASYLRNKQHLNLWDWPVNQQNRFFLTYGFGYFDFRESPIFFGIQRMYYIEGGEAQLTFGNLNANKFQNTAFVLDFVYKFMSMQTEERDAKNLFGANMHRFKGRFAIEFFKNKSFNWQIALQTQNNLRFGKENIYEAYVPDENYPSIYDFRLVSVRKRYSDVFSWNSLQNKFVYTLPQNRLSMELLAGAAVSYRKSAYKKPAAYWSVFSVLPLAGLGINQTGRAWEWGFSSQFRMKVTQEHDYSVKSGKYRIDYQTTFLPFAYYADESYHIFTDAYISYKLKKRAYRIGLALQYYVRNGMRPEEIVYSGTPAIKSKILSEPKIGRVDNVESWINLMFFISL